MPEMTLEEAEARLAEYENNPNPFSYGAIYRNPIKAWLYVLNDIRWIDKWERHLLLFGIANIRRKQGGKIDEEKTQRILDDVAAGKYEH